MRLLPDALLALLSPALARAADTWSSPHPGLYRDVR